MARRVKFDKYVKEEKMRRRPLSERAHLYVEHSIERACLGTPRGTRGVCALAAHDDRQSRAISLPQAKRGRGRPPTHHFKAQRPAVGVRCASVAARSVRHIAGPSCLVVLTISLSLAPPCFAATTNPTQPNIALPIAAATRSPGHRQDQYGRRQAHVLCCLRSLPQFTNPRSFKPVQRSRWRMEAQRFESD